LEDYRISVGPEVGGVDSVKQAVWHKLFVAQTILVVACEEASEKFGVFLVTMDRHRRCGYFSGLTCVEQLVGNT
jgi:hypothetical protein